MEEGTHFDQYYITQLLGKGGMSRVFEAVDSILDRTVALKILHKEYNEEEELIAQFEREAKITASITHPNVINVYSVGKDHGYFYIAMEAVNGGSLDDLISQKEKIPELEVLDLAIDVASGLKAANDVGLIHRDLKPGNILFTKEGVAKIVDFGLAIAQDADEDSSEEVWATPYYVAPEKLTDAKEDVRSDIYSFGATLFHALAGRPPYEAETTSLIIEKHLNNEPVSLQLYAPYVSHELAQVIDKTLEKNPQARYQNYTELLEDLERVRAFFKERGLIHVERITGRKKSQKSRQLVGMSIAAICVVLACGGIVVAQYLNREKPPEVSPPFSEKRESQPISSQYLEARENHLLQGDYWSAKQGFQVVFRSPYAKQPTASWAGLNAGLCFLLLGEKEEATSIFHELLKQKNFVEIEESALRDFFVGLGKEMVKASPVAEEALKFCSLHPVNAIAALLYGLKNWQIGEFEKAYPFLAYFQQVTPEESYAWYAKYKIFSDSYLHDYALMKPLLHLEEDPSLEELKELIPQLSRLERELQNEGAAKEKITKQLAEYKERVSILEEQMIAERQAAQQQERLQEETKLSRLLETIDRRNKQYQFKSSLEELKRSHWHIPQAKKIQASRIDSLQSADSFIEQLRRDINTNGFRGAVQLSSEGKQMRVSVRKIEGEKMHVNDRRGMRRVIDLKTIHPQSLIRIAEKQLAEVNSPYEYMKRKEKIIWFSWEVGEKEFAVEEAEKLMQEDVSFRRKWREFQRHHEERNILSEE